METGTHHPEPFGSSTGRTESVSTGQAKEKATELSHRVRDRAMATLDQRKEQVCELLERVADGTRDDQLGGYASEYARRGAEFLRRQSADELFDSMRRGFRSRPGVVLSAAFVAGLAFARLMKGSMGAGGGESDERRFDAGRWAERGYGESGYPEPRGYGASAYPEQSEYGASAYPEGSARRSDIERDAPWREDEP